MKTSSLYLISATEYEYLEILKNNENILFVFEKCNRISIMDSLKHLYSRYLPILVRDCLLHNLEHLSRIVHFRHTYTRAYPPKTGCGGCAATGRIWEKNWEDLKILSRFCV